MAVSCTSLAAPPAKINRHGIIVAWLDPRLRGDDGAFAASR